MLKQRLQQKLLQKLSPQQIQMIKLLEVPTLQIEQRIKKELEENPALDEGSDEDEIPSETEQEEISRKIKIKTRKNSHSMIIWMRTIFLITVCKLKTTAKMKTKGMRYLFQAVFHFRNILNHNWDSEISPTSRRFLGNTLLGILMKMDI